MPNMHGPADGHHTSAVETNGVVAIHREAAAHAVRDHEERQREFTARLAERKRHGEEVQQRVLADLDRREKEYSEARAERRRRLDESRVELEAEHRSAAEHCQELAVSYQPGKTTKADILWVPRLDAAEVARQLELPFGVGVNDILLNRIKWILTLCCWITAATSLGLTLRILARIMHETFTKPRII